MLLQLYYLSKSTRPSLSRYPVQLAEIDPVPPYEATEDDNTRLSCHSISEDTTITSTTITKSAKYPRVAVLLGVKSQYYIPLLLCRSLSTISALWWAVLTTINIYQIIMNSSAAEELGNQNNDSEISVMAKRLLVVQILLSYLWAMTAAYLAHLFASSLMSRWLQHYSPVAVLVRLCSLSILLSYGCSQLFRVTGALAPTLESLSRGLSLWVSISVGLLVTYFANQQDISIEEDRDDRQRRLVLRLKCLYATASSSLLSLMVIIFVIQFGSRRIPETPETWNQEIWFRVNDTGKMLAKAKRLLKGEL